MCYGRVRSAGAIRSRAIPTVRYFMTCFSQRYLSRLHTVRQHGLVLVWQQSAGRAKLDTFLIRCERLCYCDKNMLTIYEIFSESEDSFFENMMTNCNHVLHHFLSDRQNSFYLRQRSHNKTLIVKPTYLHERDFIIFII